MVYGGEDVELNQDITSKMLELTEIKKFLLNKLLILSCLDADVKKHYVDLFSSVVKSGASNWFDQDAGSRNSQKDLEINSLDVNGELKKL